MVAMVIAWQGPMWNDCGACNFVRRSDLRIYCAAHLNELTSRCRTLAANIGVAGALCAAFTDGIQNCCDWSCTEPCEVCWRPGCQRSADGWGR